MAEQNLATRQEMADLLIGWKPGMKHASPSRINELRQIGRAIMAPDGKHYLIAETLALNANAADPSKQGVADRHSAARAAVPPPPDAGSQDEPAQRSQPSERDAAIGSSYQQARAVKEKFFALEAKRAYEVAIGTLRDAREVEGLVATAMVEIRQRLENLATSIAPIVAAQADEAAVRATLREAFEHTLKSASHHFDQLKKAAN